MKDTLLAIGVIALIVFGPSIFVYLLIAFVTLDFGWVIETSTGDRIAMLMAGFGLSIAILASLASW
jgi:hypothetical protein